MTAQPIRWKRTVLLEAVLLYKHTSIHVALYAIFLLVTLCGVHVHVSSDFFFVQIDVNSWCQ